MSSASDPKAAQSTTGASSPLPTDTVVHKTASPRRAGSSFFALRRPIPQWQGILLGVLCIALIFCLWWLLTAGPSDDDRVLKYRTLPSPAETFDREQLHQLWFDNALTRNLFASLRRVVFGFTLAACVGIPLGVLCGCFSWINSFFAPINVFGRNIPIAALIPLTFALFGIDETQKVMFIFVAAVAFVMMDTATAIADVSSRYIDTAYTLGASKRQIILKVLVPLAMPRVMNSLRLLFGLAFGYIMLAELITQGGQAGGLGNIINVAQRRGHQEPIMLILIIIPAVALAIDRIVFIVQRSLFPYQYGGTGILHDAWRGLMHLLEAVKQLAVAPKPLDSSQAALIATKTTAVPNQSRPAN
jgi:ABC-type nitrate/sulfonate/bicarbonate transport system permease component